MIKILFLTNCHILNATTLDTFLDLLNLIRIMQGLN